MALHSSIDRDNLHILMRTFYAKAIEHQELSPFFMDEIGEDLDDEEWHEHIDLLADFWLTEMLGEDTYYGNFVGAHVKMPRIQHETVQTWLELFSETVDEVYLDEVAQRFKKKAFQLSQQFIYSKKNI